MRDIRVNRPSESQNLASLWWAAGSALASGIADRGGSRVGIGVWLQTDQYDLENLTRFEEGVWRVGLNASE